MNTYNFNNDQIWGYSTNGSICASNTSGSFSVSNEFTILGGSGIFTGATGTVTQKQSMVIEVPSIKEIILRLPPIICLTGLPRIAQGVWSRYQHLDRNNHTIVSRLD